MDIRFESSAKETMSMNTEDLREKFLIKDLMVSDKVSLTYTHYDRNIAGGVNAVNEILILQNNDELKADYFLERIEMGIINLGGKGSVKAGGKDYELNKLDCLYLGKGNKEVIFKSELPG